MDQGLNEGIYADEKVAQEWVNWTKKFGSKDTRSLEIYPYVSAWIDENKPHTVVDIGSGSGLLYEKINFDSRNYIGVEPSSHLRDMAKVQFPGVDFRPGKAESLPFGDGEVEAAFSIFVWLHIKDLNKAAKELSRILKNEGIFLIVTADPASYDIWRSWHSNMTETDKELKGDMKHLPNHQMFLHTEKEILDSFKNNCLEVEKVKRFEGSNVSPAAKEDNFAVAIVGKRIAG